MNASESGLIGAFLSLQRLLGGENYSISPLQKLSKMQINISVRL